MLPGKIRCFHMTLLLLVSILLFPSLVRARDQPKDVADSLMANTVFFQFAVYFLPKAPKDGMGLLQAVLTSTPAGPKLVKEPPQALEHPFLMAHLEKDVLHNYQPPDMESLQYFSRGLSREQALALQTSEQALILDFVHPKAQVWSALKAASEIVEDVAREADGLIWDEETREIYTPDEWHKQRVETWIETIPNVTRHTIIHAYQDEEYVRAITLGMAKFGLPDVVVQNFSWSLNRNMGNLINALCQLMAEGVKLGVPSSYDLNFHQIKNGNLRDSYMTSLIANGKGVAHLVLVRGVAKEGDPRNRLIEIVFDKYPGSDVHARQETMLNALFGWEDSIKRIKHNEELIKASNRARAKLPELRKAFNAGLAPAEFIQVKAPFGTPRGDNEWMWVEITEWTGDQIRGLLKNEPFDIPNLHGGQIVKVREEDVFDFIHSYPNGRQDGNETSRIIEKMRGDLEQKN